MGLRHRAGLVVESVLQNVVSNLELQLEVGDARVFDWELDAVRGMQREAVAPADVALGGVGELGHPHVGQAVPVLQDLRAGRVQADFYFLTAVL